MFFYILLFLKTLPPSGGEGVGGWVRWGSPPLTRLYDLAFYKERRKTMKRDSSGCIMLLGTIGWVSGGFLVIGTILLMKLNELTFDQAIWSLIQTALALGG